jgi:hypothetical protein
MVPCQPPLCAKVMPPIRLHLHHMETIGVREVQRHASAALRRVEQGESFGVADRGRSWQFSSHPPVPVAWRR